MKVKQSSWFPFGRFYAINWFGTIYYKDNRPLSQVIYNHELIHDYQAKDFCKNRIVGYSIFYIIYLICWLIELFRPPYNKAYSTICFEKEAKQNHRNLKYVETRKRFSWLNKKYWKN